MFAPSQRTKILINPRFLNDVLHFLKSAGPRNKQLLRETDMAVTLNFKRDRTEHVYTILLNIALYVVAVNAK